MTNRQISPHTASFEKIFREYYPVLLPFVERHVGERELAKDLVQDVFLKLYKSYPYFSSEVNIKSWLYTSSRNAALDYLRHLKVRDNNKLLMAEAMMYAADVDEVISEELTRKIHEAIDSLPLQCCQIVRMHIIDGKKYTEISAELGISINTIKTQIFRGYKKLRELLADDLNALVLFFFKIICPQLIALHSTEIADSIGRNVENQKKYQIFVTQNKNKLVLSVIETNCRMKIRCLL